MRRLANGRERDPLCACKHGPAVHTAAGECRLQHSCACTGWRAMPYVYDEPACDRCPDLAEPQPCQRCAALEEALRGLGADVSSLPIVAVPSQRVAEHDELRRAATRDNRGGR